MPAWDVVGSYKACTPSDTVVQPSHQALYISVGGTVVVRAVNDTADVTLNVNTGYLFGNFPYIRAASTATIFLVN